MWISAEFKIYLIKEFQRLKNEEYHKIGWDVKRFFSKVNYKIHTESIRINLIPNELSSKEYSKVYASEAEVLNVALFGLTSKEWKLKNPSKKGNIRDYANVSQLVCLANLGSLNSYLINENKTQAERLKKLNEVAIFQMSILINEKSKYLLN